LLFIKLCFSLSYSTHAHVSFVVVVVVVHQLKKLIMNITNARIDKTKFGT